jgi:SulP family sulfate permease
MAANNSGLLTEPRVAKFRPVLTALRRNVFKDITAGIAASVVSITNIISFGALLFPADLNAGVPIAIWAMLIGSCLGGVWIALNTSLPPMASGMDSPTVAVLAVLSTIIGSQILAAGATEESAVQSLMLIFSAATLMSGVLLFVVGARRLGAYLRFVPYCVVAGFLAAAGFLLVAGGVRLVTGRAHHVATLFTDWNQEELLKLGSAVASLLVLLATRRWMKWAFKIPFALLAMWAIAAVALRSLGLSDQAYGWYLSAPESTGWSLFGAFRTSALSWSMMPSVVPELIAVVAVSFISLISKITSIEIARQVSGELDRELRSHGIACLIAAPFGGLATSVQPATSLLLEHAGSATRISGVVSAAVLGLVAITNLGLPSMIPIAIIGALIFYLGFNFIVDALWRPYRQRAWLDLLLAIAIMGVCIRFGYLVGVLVGILCSCVIFAISYARVGVIRGHVTRARFSSYVERSPEASRYLRENGDAIWLYWLSGYVFFGSSEGVFERIRHDIELPSSQRASYIVLDFGIVSGVDSSALFSLLKLRNLAEQHGTTLVYSALLPAIRSNLEVRGLLGGNTRHRAFPDLNSALTWCEDQMLDATAINASGGVAGFYRWLQHQFGPGVDAAEFAAYLECKEIPASQVIYRQGEPADTIDLVAAGTLAIDVLTGDGQIVRMRRMTTRTVVGEMGFFCRSARSATVSAEEPATLFTLSRANFTRLRGERPELASAFDDFVIRTLAERVDFSNHAVAALSRPQ